MDPIHSDLASLDVSKNFDELYTLYTLYFYPNKFAITHNIVRSAKSSPRFSWRHSIGFPYFSTRNKFMELKCSIGAESIRKTA
uniref:Ovule protein n=1 Tax=Steinernema glaseri TaxID=37863 RepID=A0A1I7Z2H6_9BILA